ncbi:MAG: hypothetical protein OEZ06_25975 [Myxococcales bacterium]|nr:hypothetical protein [Myxococcales bacterium]
MTRRDRVMLLPVLGLVVLLNARSLGAGLLADDLLHRSFILGQLDGAPGPFWNMFDAGGRGGPSQIGVAMFSGALPWWTNPELKIAFFRPLAVICQYIDYLLWPNTPWLMHLHNLLWYLGTVVLVAGIYLRVAEPRRVAVIALLLYAIDEAHAGGLLWIAGRNTLMTAFFVALALWLHLRGRAGELRHAPVLAALALLLALASSEGGITLWGYLLGHALFVDRAPWRERLRALAPMLAVSLIFRGVYRGLNYGVTGSGIYRDPTADPIGFVRVLPERLPLILVEQFTLPQGLPAFVPPALHGPLLFAATGLLLLLGVWLCVAGRRRPVLWFWASGMLAGVLSVCAIGVMPRLLFVSAIGACALLAELIDAAYRALRARAPLARRLGLAALGAIVLFIHGPLALALAPLELDRALHMAGYIRRASRGLPPDRIAGRALLVLNSPNYLVSMMELWHRPEGKGRVVATYLFGVTIDSVSVERTASNALELSTRDGYLREATSWLVRAPELPFAVGYRVQTGAITVIVLEVTDDGRPRRVRLQGPLESPDFVWAAWTLGRYQEVRLPAVGERVELPAFDPGPEAQGEL